MFISPHPPNPLPQQAKEGGESLPRIMHHWLFSDTAPKNTKSAVKSPFPSSLGKGRGWGGTALSAGFFHYGTIPLVATYHASRQNYLY